MSRTQNQQRELLGRIFEDLGRGICTSLRDASVADVSWWLPLGATQYLGIDDVERVLVATLGDGNATLQSVVVGADGRSAVVEQLLDRAGGTTPATSLLTLSGGAVVAGRTYLDVAAWSGAEVAHHA